MAELLTPQEVFFTAFEPKVQNRYVMYLEGIPAVIEWIRLSHESVTGRNGYADFYKKDIVFNVLGPVGDKVEEWSLKGAYISEANFGDLSWAEEQPVEISVTMTYDYAVLQF
jgi:hypothetical protein